MTQAHSVSIIIPTRNRSQDLAETIRNLFQQETAPRELIIVDQSPGDEGRKRIEEIYGNQPAELRENTALHYVLDPSIRGVSAARNVGMDIASSEIFLFLDDDVALEPDFIKELLVVYKDHPEVDGVSGIITNYKRVSLPSRMWTAIFAHGPFHDERQPVYWNAEKLRPAEPIQVWNFTGACMSFRADSLQNLRFDPNLDVGEDTDLCTRINHGKLVIAPRARLIHKRTPAARSQEHWLGREARSAGSLYRKNWDHGVRNRVCFVWLNFGYVLLATAASLLRLSFMPWRSLVQGIQQATRTRSSHGPVPPRVEV
jgi:GT2 family glycosyltransferase